MVRVLKVLCVFGFVYVELFGFENALIIPLCTQFAALTSVLLLECFSTPDINLSSLFAFSLFVALTFLVCFIPFELSYWAHSFMCLSFASLYIWIEFRPKAVSQSNVHTEQLSLLFYKGSRMSLPMLTLSLIGLPVSSLSVAYQGICVKPVKSSDRFELTDVDDLDATKYVVLNTGISLTPYQVDELLKVVGKKAYSARTLGIRVRCVSNFARFLSTLGKEWEPKGIYRLPSMYVMKVLRLT